MRRLGEPHRERLSFTDSIRFVPGTDIVSQDINVLALIKGEERYIFLYDDQNRAETLRMLGRYASDKDLSFTWYDAAVLSQKVRRQSEENEPSAHRMDVSPTSDGTEDWPF